MKETKVKVIEYRGITLMSLVITVIVLLILAGISIGMISGEKGILNKARKSKNSIDEATTLEYIKTSIAASRTPDNDVSEQTLQKELDKFFDKSEIIVVNENDYMIKINDKIYNYSNGEVTSGYELKTSTNGIIEVSKDPKIVSSKIYGNSIQDGDPSPDSPIEIQSVGDLVTDENDANYGKYKVPIIVRGKNLWDRPNVNANKSGTQVFNASDYYWIKNNTEITFSADVNFKEDDTRTSPRISISVFYEDGTYIVNGNFNIIKDGNTRRLSVTINTGSKEITKIIFRTNDYSQNTEGVWNASADNMQIELGDTETKYESYVEPTTINLYLNEPLRKIGDYADYIDLNNKKIIRNVKHIEFSGNEDWSKYVSVDKHYQFMVKDNKFSDSTNLVLSNYYKADKTTGGYFSSKDYAVISVDGSRIRFKDKDISSVDEWKAKLQTYFNNGNSLKTDYVLVSSTEEDIDVDIPDMLNAIKGTKILAINTKVQPDNIETIYYN